MGNRLFFDCIILITDYLLTDNYIYNIITYNILIHIKYDTKKEKTNENKL